MKKNNKKKAVLSIGIVIFIITVVIIISILSTKEKNNNVETFETIKYSNLKDALNGYYNQINLTNDANKSNELLKKLEKYVLEDLQGYYYYREDNTQTGSAYMKNTFPERFTNESDNRAIYVKSKDEVYIFPYSEEYMKENNIELTALDSIENAELYKYKILELKTNDKDGAYFASKSAKIKLQSYYIYEKFGDTANKYYYNIDIDYYTSDDDYNFTGYFADMIGDNDDVTIYKDNLKNGISHYRHYFRDKDLAISKNLESMQEYASDKQQKEILKNSIPTVGMTDSQVRSSKWGNPDKINKDTYSWGTTEQWVYDKYGYVYFKNGIVSSVSER